jgi:hypothetical protein
LAASAGTDLAASAGTDLAALLNSESDCVWHNVSDTLSATSSTNDLISSEVDGSAGGSFDGGTTRNFRTEVGSSTRRHPVARR